MLVNMEKLIIIGSGPAGYTAALYAARAELAPLLLTGEQSGGQLMWTTEVENFPGFPEGIEGPELMTMMRKQAQRFGAKIITDQAISVDFSKKNFTVKTAQENYSAPAIIIATGASAMWLNVPGEQ